MMTRDNFIKQQDITHLDRKQKKRNWNLHTNLAISLHTCAFNHLDGVFYFQDVNEINGIHVPFIIGIQTPFQLHSMITLSNNGAISMPPLASMM